MYDTQFEKAEAVLAEAHTKAPLDGRVRQYRAIGQLLQGDLAPDVFREYLTGLESQPGMRPKPPLPTMPPWDGSPCPGQTILLWSPIAGLGDWIMLSRLIPAMKAQSQGRVALLLPKGLARLLAGLADQVYEGTLPPDAHIDQQVCLSWLPAIVPLTEKILSSPYLHAEEDAVERWRHLFADRDVVHIGLQWRSGTGYKTAKARTISLAALEEMFCIPHTRLYSLQYDGASELAKYPLVMDLGNVDAPDARFCETSGIMMNLDAVVCIDSSIGHLSGALGGIPTWLILGPMFNPQWGLDTETAWYPQHTLHRMQGDDWGDLGWSRRAVLEGFVVRTLYRRGIICD
jgi:hypothetical protein